MKAMIPTFDLDLAQPHTAADYVRHCGQIDDLLQLRRASSLR
jgi:hypothetical protein